LINEVKINYPLGIFLCTIFRLKDESLEASDNLPDPDVIAQEIVEDLEAALEQGNRGGFGLTWRNHEEAITLGMALLVSRGGAEGAEKS
jgi:hypothetical protein